MAAKRPEGALEFEFDGKKYQINKKAIQSMKVQRAMAYDGIPEKMHEVWDAMDKIFDGRTVEYMDALGEDGQGCSAERWGRSSTPSCRRARGYPCDWSPTTCGTTRRACST